MEMPQDKWVTAKKDATTAAMTPKKEIGMEKDVAMMQMMSEMNAKMDQMMSMMSGKGM